MTEKKLKKILLLGGSRFLVPVILKAKELGLYVITCDFLPNNIAHRYSDEYHNISIIDKEQVLKLSKKLKIDGIMSFASDPGVITAAYVAESLNLPSPGPLKSIEILQNKDKFRSFLYENNFLVPAFWSFNKKSDALDISNEFEYPLIIKPTDSAGSKGVTKVNCYEELSYGIDTALKYSISNSFIIEKFIEKSEFSSDCDSFSLNGKLIFSSYSSQRFQTKSASPYVPIAYSWPSSFSVTNVKKFNGELERLLSLLNMNTGIYNIETRVGNDGKEYIMEVAPRGGGNRLAEMVNYVYGVDLIKASIKAALGLSIDVIKPKISKSFFCELILHTYKSGLFSGIEINDSIKNNIIELDLWVNKNDYVSAFTSANYALGTVTLSFNDRNVMDTFLEQHEKFIKIIIE